MSEAVEPPQERGWAGGGVENPPASPACSAAAVPDTLPSSPVLHVLMLPSHPPGAAHRRRVSCWQPFPAAPAGCACGEALPGHCLRLVWDKQPLPCAAGGAVPSCRQGRVTASSERASPPAGALPSGPRPGRGDPTPQGCSSPSSAAAAVLPGRHTRGDTWGGGNRSLGGDTNARTTSER